MKSKSLLKAVFIFLIGLTSACAQPSELVSDNGVLKLKLDLTRGGAISYISKSGSDRNVVNVYDEGRYIQQSYYAGKTLDRKADGQAPRWSPWSWNPIQVGDDYRNRTEILDYKKSGDTLYVKCIPMQWDMNNKPAEAEMEQWNVMMDNVIKVHCKLTCHRTDTIYGENIENHQELPAVYPISALDKLYAYLGDKPFSNDTLSTPEVINLSSGFWGIYPNVPEHWMAFTDLNDWGFGVYNSQCSYFYAGMSGKPGGEANDKATSYIAPSVTAVINKNTVFEYDYYLIIGTINEIREQVYKLDSEINK